MKMKEFYVAMFAAILLAGCAGSQTIPSHSLTYPYVASPKRQAQILNGLGKVEAGMSPSEVKSFLGDPDEIRELYDRIKNAEPVGYTWWFIVERKSEAGSVVEKAEKLVRVSFDVNDKATQVDSWGLKKETDKSLQRTR
jgi:hypothetical protein